MNDSLPNFFVIGAMKSATSTLHEQLASQDGIFMSGLKEPNFFSDDDKYEKGVEWYKSIFTPSENDTLIGESSTHYTKFPTYPETINRLKEHIQDYQDLKFVYVMRHPIDRLVSHYMQEVRLRQIPSDMSIDSAILKHERFASYGKYTMQLKPYFENFDKSCFLPVFFERLANEPHPEFERVCDFLGHEGSPKWQEDMNPSNSSSDMMSDSKLRDKIVNAPGLSTIRQKFVPQSARDRVKKLWIKDAKPEMTTKSREYLQEIFDQDLQELSQALNISPLTCENYKEAVLADSDDIKTMKF